MKNSNHGFLSENGYSVEGMHYDTEIQANIVAKRIAERYNRTILVMGKHPFDGEFSTTPLHAITPNGRMISVSDALLNNNSSSNNMELF